VVSPGYDLHHARDASLHVALACPAVAQCRARIGVACGDLNVGGRLPRPALVVAKVCLSMCGWVRAMRTPLADARRLRVRARGSAQRRARPDLRDGDVVEHVFAQSGRGGYS